MQPGAKFNKGFTQIIWVLLVLGFDTTETHTYNRHKNKDLQACKSISTAPFFVLAASIVSNSSNYDTKSALLIKNELYIFLGPQVVLRMYCLIRKPLHLSLKSIAKIFL